MDRFRADDKRDADLDAIGRGDRSGFKDETPEQAAKKNAKHEKV